MGLLAISLAALVGCGDDGGGAAGTGGTGGTGGGGGTNMSLVSITFLDGPSGPPVEGVEVCEVGGDYCVMSDSAGYVGLLLPIGEEVAFTAVKEGFIPYLGGGVPPERGLDFGEFGMARLERLSYQHDLVGSPWPMEDTGDIVIININGADLPGTTLELSPSTGIGFYYNEDHDWDTDLTETTSASYYGLFGGWTQVSPGEVEVTWGGTAAGRCTIIKGWPSEKPNTMRIPVMAGFLSQQDLLCTPP
jgi:hypothetical protein